MHGMLAIKGLTRVSFAIVDTIRTIPESASWTTEKWIAELGVHQNSFGLGLRRLKAAGLAKVKIEPLGFKGGKRRTITLQEAAA